MTVILPDALPSASGWRLYDYARAQLQTPAAVGGIAQLEAAQLAGDEMWLIDHAVIYCTSSTPTAARLYASSVAPTALLDGTASGGFDVADWPAGLQLGPSSSLIAQWAGASDGAIGTLSIQYRRLRRV